MQFEISTLANGLRVVSSENPNSETVSLGFWINTGAAYESETLNGVSHFLEHMFFKGTPTRSAIRISEEIEDLGGHLNAYTGREFTAFYAKMLKADAGAAVAVLTDILRNSSFSPEELAKEKDVVTQEIKQAFDTPDDVVFDFLQAAAFPAQAVGRTILGPEANVRSFEAPALRAYLASNYAAENMAACAVGNIRHGEFVKMVEAGFGDFSAKTAFAIEPQVYKGGYFAESRDIEQAQVTIAFEGLDYASPDYYAGVLLSTILGGGMSSRLFNEVREKRGLAYSAYSFCNSHSRTGLFGIYAGTNEHQIKELVPVIGGEIKKIRGELVLESELARAKAQSKAGILMGLESSSACSEFLARRLLTFGRIEPIADIVARIDAVSREDLLRLAGKVFSTNPSYAVLGDFGNSSPAYEELLRVL